MSIDEFAAALEADVAIDLCQPGLLSIAEALALRGWYNRRQKELCDS